jgi:hypothetical protein
LAKGVPRPQPKRRFKFFKDFGFIRAIAFNPPMQVLSVNIPAGFKSPTRQSRRYGDGA